MSEVLKVVSYGFGTILGLILIGIIVFWFIQDVTQKKHSILRNYPVIGHLRFLFEKQGEYFRQYFFSGDRDEMPFNRATRSMGVQECKERGRHRRFRLHQRPARARLHHFRQCRFSGTGARPAADSVASRSATAIASILFMPGP